MAALTVAAALWPEARSGALRTWAATPDRTAFRWLIQRVGLALGAVAALIIAGMLLGTLVNLLLGIPPQPSFDPGFFVGYLFSAALTLTGVLLFRHLAGGIALSVAYWLLDVRLSAAGNPLFTLHLLTAQLDNRANPVSNWLNKPLLLALSAVMLAWCSGAASRIVQPFNRREPPRYAALMCGGLIVALAAQLALSVGVSYLARKPMHPLLREVEPLNQGVRTFRAPELRGTSIRSLGAPMEVFKPLPVSLLFGPVYHRLVNLPAAKPQPGGGGLSAANYAAAGPRIAALNHLVEAYGAWPWADTAAYELAIARTEVDGVAAMKDYWNVAERYPNSPNAADSLATIMRTTQVWVLTEKGPRSKSKEPFERFPRTMPLQPRLSAAIALLQRHPNSVEAADARAMALEYYPALIRPDVMLTVAPKAAAATRGPEKAQWLAILAEIQLNRGQYPEAEKTFNEARKEIGSDTPGGLAGDNHSAHRLERVEQILEVWRRQQRTGENP